MSRQKLLLRFSNNMSTLYSNHVGFSPSLLHHSHRLNLSRSYCTSLEVPEDKCSWLQEAQNIKRWKLAIRDKDGSGYDTERVTDAESPRFQFRSSSSSSGVPQFYVNDRGSGTFMPHCFNHGSMNENNGVKVPLRRDAQVNGTSGNLETGAITVQPESYVSKQPVVAQVDYRERLARMYSDVLVVDSISSAKKVVQLLTTKYRDFVHACDTEVSKIDVKQETPVNHGEIICFSIYSGSKANFGMGKLCIWVDVLDGGGKDLLMEFAPFFEDSSIRKKTMGLKFLVFMPTQCIWQGFGILQDGTQGGYSLKHFTSDSKVMNGTPKRDSKVINETRKRNSNVINEDPKRDSNVMNGVSTSDSKELIGKISMKTIFGNKKLRRDGTEGKFVAIAPVEELQREQRVLWICYSALDSVSTLQLFESLQNKLKSMSWAVNENNKGTMFDFYEKYWRPFGELLVNMETEGMLVDRAYLAEIQKVASMEQETAGNRFRKWAARYCADAIHMNVGSDTQLRTLLFGGTTNSKDPNEVLPEERVFKVPNVDRVIGEGKKIPSKFRDIRISSCKNIKIESAMFTPTGWPSVSGDALKTLAGKVSSEYDWIDDVHGFESEIDNSGIRNDLERSADQNGKKDVSSYGTAYEAFGSDKDGKEACHAIAALCDVCSIHSLISNFILPLQNNRISGKNGRIHCSLNINTETGRLSARRPNLQNQPALEKDRYKIRQAFVAAPGCSLVVADYGQLELRILAHLANCKSMKNAFKEGDTFASERRKAKMLNFSIAYGKTPVGLALDWKVSVKEARETVELWYRDRKEVLSWQEERKQDANRYGCVKTLLGRTRSFPSMNGASNAYRGHIERAAINTPVQGSAADVAMCAMLEISRNAHLKELGWRLLLQVHDEVILEGPTESAEVAKVIVVDCMSKPFVGTNILSVDLAVDAKCAQNWYAAK
ncbi:hypothetical protein IFM89_007806 [Coptis chinensis]|uniref:DNA-directed DNA polymerase family A palm domain-containing protein n=1 Tax=Coptis chinensis TaxID=261450 RepID=A0A835IVQ6_9MAGN|nr:hypothetical protein IFM89_007806 [Coptis chinensis]